MNQALIVEAKRNRVGFAVARNLYAGAAVLERLWACQIKEKRAYFSADCSRFMGLTIYAIPADPEHCEVL